MLSSASIFGAFVGWVERSNMRIDRCPEMAITVKSSMPLAIIRLSAACRNVWRLTPPVGMFARFKARLNT